MEPITLNDGTQLDPKVVKVMQTIRQLESGGQKDPYNAIGDRGNSRGAYQFNEKTGIGWKGYAKQYLGDENAPMTPGNQNKAMYGWIKEQKDRGLNPEEIDALHNGARKDPKTGRYVHNSAERAQKFREAILGGVLEIPKTPQEQRSELIDQGQPVSVNEERTEPTAAGKIVRGALKTPAKVLTSLVQLGQVVGGKSLEEASEPFSGKYLGRVPRLGEKFDPSQGLTKDNLSAVKESVGAGAELASYAVGGGGAANVAKATLRGRVIQGAGAGAKAGAGSGFLAGTGSALQEDKTVGQSAVQGLIGAGTGAALGGITGGVLPVLGKARNAIVGKTDEVLLKEAEENSAKALGVFGKKPAKLATSQPAKMSEGLAVIRKYAPEIEEGGIKRAFDPVNSDNPFDDTLKAWQVARDNVFKRYDSVARQAGEKGAMIKTKPLEGFLERYSKGITTAPKRARAQRLLTEIRKNFPEGEATPVQLQDYVKLLNEELGGLTGGAEKGATGVTAEFVKLARENLDDAITKSTGKEYQAVRNEYAALKSVEDGLVRQYQKIIRKRGSGLTEYADLVANADVLSSIVSGNPALMARGVALRVGSKFIKSLQDPATYLKDAFKAIDKLQAKVPEVSKIAPKVDSIALPKTPPVLAKSKPSLYEPYIPPEKLPVIKMGSKAKSKGDLPVIR